MRRQRREGPGLSLPAGRQVGRYLYRGVLQEKDILACENGQVTFRYRNSKTGRFETRTVPGAQFLWLLLRHVLPKGFRRGKQFRLLAPQ